MRKKRSTKRQVGADPKFQDVLVARFINSLLKEGKKHIARNILYTAFNLPYVIWMMRGYILDIPRALEESALVDGCTRWQVIWKVGFPMSRAGLFATAIFTFVFACHDFIFALVLTRTEVATYTVQVTHYFGGQSNFWAKISAMSVLGTVPIFVAVAFMQRYLVRGISLGAVKG